ncbi:hypothetical protein PIB30_029827 [Stylosanthes scabra]|uniref:Uncharacterized protein n=1 Tax=Stylosanthes scabra TaxID=79078 RepID=A0ABU6WCD2_9FABA|nr:hypothetical protein [Stylosanthes scabra]
MNKTPEEAWELIESVADNHQCFNTIATSSVRGMYEIAPSDITMLAKYLADITTHHHHKLHPSIAEFVRVIPITRMNVPNCKKIMSLHPPTTTMMDPHKTANTNHNPKGGVTINKGVGILTNNLNTANPTTTIHHKIPKTQDTNIHIVDNPSNNNSQLSYEEAFRLSQQENKEMREVAKRTEAQMLPSTSTPQPPPNPSPLPSQPLPNPKGRINVVEKGDEKKEKKDARTKWLIELIAKANAMVESDD